MRCSYYTNVRAGPQYCSHNVCLTFVRKKKSKMWYIKNCFWLEKVYLVIAPCCFNGDSVLIAHIVFTMAYKHRLIFLYKTWSQIRQIFMSSITTPFIPPLGALLLLILFFSQLEWNHLCFIEYFFMSSLFCVQNCINMAICLHCSPRWINLLFLSL